jgi:hypothetical protein
MSFVPYKSLEIFHEKSFLYTQKILKNFLSHDYIGKTIYRPFLGENPLMNFLERFIPGTASTLNRASHS